MIRRISIICALGLLMVSCGNNSDEPGITPDSSKKTMKIATRAADGQLENYPKVGIYVSYDQNLKASGNYVDNLLLSYAGGNWTPASQLYWKDLSLKADIYGYCPYVQTIGNTAALSFALAANQTEESKYYASDFLWGVKKQQTPTEQTVNLTLNHLMSRININLKAGEGFKESDLKSGNLKVEVRGVKMNASVNLATGAVSASGDAVNVTPCKISDLSYKVIVAPQKIEEKEIIRVTLGNATYNLKKAVNLESNKQYTATVTLSKTAGGINVGIGEWEKAEGDFGGTVN